ncbi:hypothetical protein CLI64_11100 [Nostoc sp. CENA543]|uniref:hypothetical protein n=1 Tax=Nostoc sp. CENA543 TaxID=1869241 RepID=UPI000CA1BA12|nr:hypothetical protein [Nostoc sp. CENA543]AUT00901.1 hypothetical protein CLI64_11100 [Nostoc sp. CENA543]
MSSFKLDLHPNQMRVFQDPKPFNLLLSGRRFGKSRLMLTKVIERSLTFNGVYDPASPPVNLLVMPTLKQARQIHWKPLENLLAGVPFVAGINKSESRIIMAGERPDILIRGCNDDDGDSLRGLKIYFCGADEFQDIKLAVWQYVIVPALSDTPGSSALLTCTPKGKAHWLYKFHLDAIASPEWSFHHYFTKHNPYIPLSKLVQARKELPEKIYNQEYRASFESFDGQFFDEMRDRHLIDKTPMEDLTYYLGIDWGDVNPCIVVVGLTKDHSRFLVLDGWLNQTSQPIVQDEFLGKMAAFCRQYNVYRSYLPDDRPASIKASREYGRKHGIRGMEKAVAVDRRAVGVVEGCQIMNNLFYRDCLHIKSSLKTLINQFQSYHRKQDRDGTILNQPADGQPDHYVDSSRYCIATLYSAIQRKNLL